MRKQLAKITPPTGLPLSLSDAKRHLGLTDNYHDTDVQSLILAARDYIEKRTGLILLTTGFRLKLDCFPADGGIELPVAPLAAVSSFTYYDVDGVSQPVASYQTWATLHVPAVLLPAPSAVWPEVQADRIDAVTVDFDAGYGAADTDVPPEARHAIRLLLRHWYDNPSAVITGTISKEIELSFRSLMASLGTGYYANV